MLRSWMMGFFFFFFSFFLIASDSRSPDSVYDNTGFEEVNSETTRPDSNPVGNSFDVAPVVRPVAKPSTPPPARVEPADPSVPVTGGRTPLFTNTSQRDRNAPIFSKFQKVFEECGEGCNAGWAHCYRNGSGNSCHSTGDALDLHSVICNGREQSATSATFKRIVACVRTKSVGSRKWKVLHMENTRMSSRDCRDASPTNKETDCHWNHAHFSAGCWRNGRLKW